MIRATLCNFYATMEQVNFVNINLVQLMYHLERRFSSKIRLKRVKMSNCIAMSYFKLHTYDQLHIQFVHFPCLIK